MKKLDHNLLDSIPDGGDDFERHFWPVINDKFTNYEVFWSIFIWDITERAGERNGKIAQEIVQLRADVPPQLIRIAMCHYTVLRSVIFINTTKHQITGTDDMSFVLENERMKNIYTHFGIIADMANRIASLIISIEEHLKGQQEEKMSREALIEKFDKWYEEHYSGAFRDYSEFFKPVNFTIHGRGEAITKIAPTLAYKYQKLFGGRLRRYRNLIHNPNAGRCYSNGKAWIPKPAHIKKYELWPEMHKGFQENPDHFEPLDDAIINDHDSVLAFLEELWNIFISKMTTLQSHSKYGTWMEDFKKVRVVVVREPTLSSSAPSTHIVFKSPWEDNPSSASGTIGNANGERSKSILERALEKFYLKKSKPK